jgi:transcriptional antiterminator RfaH
MHSFSGGWYVIYTKPRHEKKIFEELSHREITSFLPLVKVLRTWNDRRKYIDSPLFPSYIFVQLKSMEDYYSGLAVDGVWHYVKFGNEMARASDKVIENIRIAVGSGGNIEVSYDEFRPGQQMIISKGPFTGLSCEIMEVNGKKKALVRVKMLQRNLLISLNTDQLMAV